jgi:hypothetical protein
MFFLIWYQTFGFCKKWEFSLGEALSASEGVCSMESFYQTVKAEQSNPITGLDRPIGG